MIDHPASWGYWSSPGLFTLIKSGDLLVAARISAKDAATVRACHGFVFDREGFAEDAAKEWSGKQQVGSFTPINKMRVFVLSERHT